MDQTDIRVGQCIPHRNVAGGQPGLTLDETLALIERTCRAAYDPLKDNCYLVARAIFYSYANVRGWQQLNLADMNHNLRYPTDARDLRNQLYEFHPGGGSIWTFLNNLGYYFFLNHFRERLDEIIDTAEGWTPGWVPHHDGALPGHIYR